MFSNLATRKIKRMIMQAGMKMARSSLEGRMKMQSNLGMRKKSESR
jgi:hypothetical protein